MIDEQKKTEPVPVPPQLANRRPNATERRAAEAAGLVDKQAQLKREAAERSARRENQSSPAAAASRRGAHSGSSISF